MNFEILKKLCRSNEQQIIYSRAKELSFLRLFENDKDLSKLQILYLYFLELYGILYSDLNAGEKYCTEEVIKDSLRTEAYLLYRKTKRNQKPDEKEKHIDSNQGDGSIIFRRKVK